MRTGANGVKLAQVCLNADLRCRYNGLKGQVLAKNRTGEAWWNRHVEKVPGAFVLFINRRRMMVTLIDGLGFELTHRFDHQIDLGALKDVFLEAFGKELGISRTFSQKYDTYTEGRRVNGMRSEAPGVHWTWIPSRG